MTMSDSPPTAPPVPPIDHREAMELAQTAYARLAEVAASLGADDWAAPTDCEGWSVRDLMGHVVGSMRSAASVRALVREQREVARRVRQGRGHQVDVMTALQLEETAGLTTEELIAECRSLVGPATAGRRRIPAPVRRFASFRVDLGSTVEKWRLGYLTDVILTRDTWLHRIDLCRAIGVEPELTPAHDGRIVADVAAEWARRHGRPYDLVLTGPAGGQFSSPGSDESLELDAVEFCRILSGRATGSGLLTTEVPF